MKKLSPEEAIAILNDMKIDIPVPKAAVTQRKRNVALDMAIEALSSSEIPNSSDTDTISRQAAIEVVQNRHMMLSKEKVLLINDLEKLPPAEPKSGRWILDRSGAYCCSECMEPCAGYVMMKPRDKFCKMCGSRNEVTE